jgi:hypothetical protein
MKPVLLAAALASLVSARPPQDEPRLAYNAVAMIECGDYTGTAFWIGRNRIVTAYHVTGERQCSIGGVQLRRVRADAMADVAELTGMDSRHYFRVNCTAPRQGGVHYGVGYAFGTFRHTQRYVANGARDSGDPEPIARGMYVFEGAAYPGMSGGPTFDRQGRVMTMINRGTRSAPMMMQGRALADSFICQR